MEFGGVKIGSNSIRSFYISNTGNYDVQIYNCSSFGSYQCQLNCFGVLHRNQGCSGMVFFNPRNEGYQSDTVMISTSQGSEIIWVHGTGNN